MSDPNTNTTAPVAPTSVKISGTEYKLPANLAAVEQIVIPYTALASAENQDAIGLYLQTLHSATGGKINLNFDSNQKLPEGFDLIVLPIATRVKNTDPKTKDTKPNVSVTTDVAICVIPGMDLLESSKEGKDFLERAVIDACSVKIRTGYARARAKDGEKAVDLQKLELPRSLEDFVTRRAAGDGEMAVWKHYAPGMLQALRQAKLTTISMDILRLCLQSAAFASQNYKKVNQEKVWDKLLQRAAAQAIKDGKSPTVFENWLKSRYEVVESDVELDELADIPVAA